MTFAMRKVEVSLRTIHCPLIACCGNCVAASCFAHSGVPCGGHAWTMPVPAAPRLRAHASAFAPASTASAACPLRGALPVGVVAAAHKEARPSALGEGDACATSGTSRIQRRLRPRCSATSTPWSWPGWCPETCGASCGPLVIALLTDDELGARSAMKDGRAAAPRRWESWLSRQSCSLANAPDPRLADRCPSRSPPGRLCLRTAHR